MHAYVDCFAPNFILSLFYSQTEKYFIIFSNKNYKKKNKNRNELKRKETKNKLCLCD